MSSASSKPVILVYIPEDNTSEKHKNYNVKGENQDPFRKMISDLISFIMFTYLFNCN